MQLADIDITNQRSGVLEGTSYELATSPAAVSVIFRTLVSGLYKNKKRAPIREYWTNALDESDTVDVHLPSLLDPRVVIRDYGPGLSHDRVMHHFTKIGGSDKRDSNEKAGTLGYGSKSAFAYTHQFTIRSFHNGEVRVYVSTLEKNFIPRLSHYATNPTTERSGLEISWNVKANDIDDFRREAQFVFFGAPERTNVKNETWKWPELDLAYEGTGFKVYYKRKDENLFSGPLVRMGPVLYPLDLRSMSINTYDTGENWVGDDILILDVPIGSVAIQDSREELGYDDRTIAYLKARLREARKEIQGWYQAEVDKIDHIVPAAHFLSKHRHRLMGRVGGGGQTWRGQKVPFNLDVRFRLSEATQYWTKTAWGRKRRWGGSEQRRVNLSFKDQSQVSFELLAKPIDVFIDLGEYKAGERILNAKWGSEKTALWIKCEDAEVQGILDYLNNPPNVTYLRDLPEPPKPVRMRKGQAGIIKTEVITHGGRYTREVDEEVEEGWYIKCEHKQTPHINGNYVNEVLVNELGLDEIYLLSEAKLKRKYFKKLKELTPDELRKMIGPVDFVKAAHHRQVTRAHCEIMSELPNLKLPADLDAIWKQIRSPGTCRDAEKVELMHRYGLLTDQEKSITVPPLPDLQALIVQRFPLLDRYNRNPADIQQYLNLMEKI
jgi:hypothetical protein